MCKSISKQFAKILIFMAAIYNQNSFTMHPSSPNPNLSHLFLAQAYAILASQPTSPSTASSISATAAKASPRTFPRYLEFKAARCKPVIKRGWNKTVTRTSTPIAKHRN